MGRENAVESVTEVEVNEWRVVKAAEKEFLTAMGLALMKLKGAVRTNNVVVRCAERFLKNHA